MQSGVNSIQRPNWLPIATNCIKAILFLRRAITAGMEVLRKRIFLIRRSAVRMKKASFYPDWDKSSPTKRLFYHGWHKSPPGEARFRLVGTNYRRARLGLT